MREENYYSCRKGRTLDFMKGVYPDGDTIKETESF